MSNEVAVVGSKEVAKPLESWGAAEDFSVTDLIIPKILIVQKMSKVLDDDATARVGEFRESLEQRFIGSNEAPPRVAVFHHDKSWVVFKKENGERKFARIDPYTLSDSDRPFEANGEENNECHNFYCLLAGEDPETCFPYVVSMLRGSRLTGKKLMNIFLKLKKQGRPSAAVLVELLSEKREKDGKPFYVFDFKLGGDTPAPMLKASRSWYDTLRQSEMNVVVDNSDIEESAKPVPSGKSTFGPVIADELQF